MVKLLTLPEVSDVFSFYVRYIKVLFSIYCVRQTTNMYIHTKPIFCCCFFTIVVSEITEAKHMSLLAAGAAGAYLCSEAFVSGATPSSAQACSDLECFPLTTRN